MTTLKASPGSGAVSSWTRFKVVPRVDTKENRRETIFSTYSRANILDEGGGNEDAQEAQPGDATKIAVGGEYPDFCVYSQ